jgi:hypothetical protein
VLASSNSGPGHFAAGEQLESSPPEVAAEPHRYFADEVAAPSVPARYKVGMFLVSCAVVLLPLIYLGLIALLGFGLYAYATGAYDFFFPEMGGRRRTYFALWFIYLIPFPIGLILMGFMLKPLMAPPRFGSVTFPVSHSENPRLFAFIGQLCQAMRAPIPSRVDVTFDVNASAGFRAGARSMFGNDIALNFGLPLAAGLTCREFAGVLAHELGHFTQRYAMRFGYLVRAVNLWFVRAVYDRDEWDDSLQAAAGDTAFGLVVGLLAQIAVAITRGVLWGLMVVGHALSSFLMRQMERHADDWAIAIAGSDGFVSMHRRIELLGASFHEALKKVSNRHEFRLPDDLPKYTALLAAQLSAEAQTHLHDARSRSRLRWFDTHPTYAERTLRAAEASVAGAIQDDHPALDLFDDFDGISKGFTTLFYQVALRKPVTPDALYPVIAPTTVAPDTGREEAHLKAYFCGPGFILKPVLLQQKHGLGLGMVTNVLANLESARNVLRGTDITPQREELKNLDAALLQALQAQALRDAAVQFEPASFPSLPLDTLSPDEIIQQLETRLTTLDQELEPLAEAGRTRLRAALSLIRSPHVGSRIENAQALQDETAGLLHVLGKLSEVFPSLRELRKQFAALQALLSFQSQPGPGTALDSVSAHVAKLLAALQQALGPTSYPFSDVTGHVLLADYARSKDFNLNPKVRLLKDAQSHLEMLFSVYYRVLGRLVEIAEHVETRLNTP